MNTDFYIYTSIEYISVKREQDAQAILYKRVVANNEPKARWIKKDGEKWKPINYADELEQIYFQNTKQPELI